MTNILTANSSARILYMTDKFGVSSAYKPAFNALLQSCGIRKAQVLTASIYTLIPNPLIKKANEGTWKFNPAMLDQITKAFDQKIAAIKPDYIVVSDPAILGVLTNGDSKSATLDKLRGSVYDYSGIPCLVTYPITAINTHVDESLLKDQDGDEISYEPYRSKRGAWILERDWEKVGRRIHGISIWTPEFEYSICRTLDDCMAAKKWLDDSMIISTDVETGCFPAQITCIGFTGLKANGACRSFVIPFTHAFKESGCFWDSIEDHKIAWAITREILNNPVPKTMHNGFYDSSYFIKYNLGVTNWIWDSMVLWWSAYMELPKTLDFVTSILCDTYQYWKDDIKAVEDKEISGRDSIESYWRYNALDCHYTLFNTLRLMQILPSNPEMAYNYKHAMMRTFSGLKMSMAGMKADLNVRDQIEVQLRKEAEVAAERFRFIIDDPDFNINSPAQKASLFYDVLGAKERTAKGRYVTNPPKKGQTRSAGAIPLKMIKTEHPYFGYVVSNLQTAMAPDKQISNVIGIKMQTPRFRTAFNAIGTVTDRFSSKKSNFWDGGNAQNIREAYRHWLAADDGCVILDVDYSQSDDVFVAYEANDPAKIAVIESGKDGHAIHGELFFKRPYDEIVRGKKNKDPDIVDPTTGVRAISKKVVHGTNFQMASLTLYMTMGRDAVVAAAVLLGYDNAANWNQDELVKLCGRLMLVYRGKYPRLTAKGWYRELANELKTRSKLTNAFGITRRFMGDPGDNGTQREATGFIGQSDTAGNMNRTMYEIDWGYIPERFRDGPNPSFGETPRQMDWTSHGFRFLLQVHDSFVIQLDTNHPKWLEAVENILYVMSRPVIINGHSVRVKTEAKIGKFWGEGMIPWNPDDPMALNAHCGLKVVKSKGK